MVLDGVESVSSTASVAVCTSVGFHAGHFSFNGSHGGPSFHNDDEMNSCDFIPLVRRSAGFSEVGQ